MKKDDQEILKEVQKNSSMAMNAIDTISEKVQDRSRSMSCQRRGYYTLSYKIRRRTDFRVSGQRGIMPARCRT